MWMWRSIHSSMSRPTLWITVTETVVKVHRSLRWEIEKGTPCIEVKSSLLLLLLLWRSMRLNDLTLLVPCYKHNNGNRRASLFRLRIQYSIGILTNTGCNRDTFGRFIRSSFPGLQLKVIHRLQYAKTEGLGTRLHQ